MRSKLLTCLAEEMPPAGLARKVRVLVVDDYPDNVESLAILLRLYGHDVDTALGGAAAIEAATARRPDVVLLDLSMPGMDGYQVAARLREMFHGGVVLIALTALGFDSDRRRCIETGFDCHLVKPADPSKLEELIRSLARSL
jgi:two-component system CheB/CheR fusion protein